MLSLNDKHVPKKDQYIPQQTKGVPIQIWTSWRVDFVPAVPESQQSRHLAVVQELTSLLT